MPKKFVKTYPRYAVRKWNPEPGQYYLSDGRVPDNKLWQVVYLPTENCVPTPIKGGTRDEVCAYADRYAGVLIRGT